MKAIAALVLLAGSVLASNPAVAQKMTSDDLKWVNRCIDDNKGATSDAIIRK